MQEQSAHLAMEATASVNEPELRCLAQQFCRAIDLFEQRVIDEKPCSAIQYSSASWSMILAWGARVDAVWSAYAASPGGTADGVLRPDDR